MGLADGDLYVSGSILSYQQANRIYQNFRGASVPSALKAGALWSKSSDDRLWHQGASELLEVFTEKTTLTFENLLSNSGFGVWSQSDASNGIATITYDAGAKGAGAAPSVGDAAVGGTSGATAKVISYTTATGAWATNDATGVFTLGAVTGTFIDNETVTFGGVETALVNGDEAIGITNDPMNNDDTADWTLIDCTLAFDTDHYEITRTAISQVISKVASLTVGKIYKIEVDIKDGTEAGVDILGYSDNVTGTVIYPTYTTAAGWVSVSWTFEAESTDATAKVGIASYLAGAANIEVKNFSCYEITPCCTGATQISLDGWFQDTTIDAYRQHNDGGTLTKDGSFYSVKLVPGATLDFIIFPLSAIRTNAEWLQQFAGRTVALGCWAKTSTASHFRINIYDGDDNHSGYHTGGGAWEWIEISATVSASATYFQVDFKCEASPAVNGDTIVYLSQPMLVFGSHIGEGNYQPKQGEIIWLESHILSNALNALLNQSDIASTSLNLEADSDAKLPKGMKAINIWARVQDTGSAGTEIDGIKAGADVLNIIAQVTPTGLTNDYRHSVIFKIPLNTDGDYIYSVDASGVNTFDILIYRYYGAQVN